MSRDDESIYEFASLDGYSLRERLTIRLADIAFYFLIRVVSRTARLTSEGLSQWDEIVARGDQPILALWHEGIFLGTYFWRDRGVAVITSKSLDGEYIARFIQRLGFGAIRGSSSRGGSRALIQMVRTMRRGVPMAFTVDGPRGPRHIAKMGAVVLAKRSGNPILPFAVTARRFIEVNSWDRLQIPMPFTRAIIHIAAPIYVEADADDAGLERRLAELQATLDDLAAKGRSWRGLSD